MSNIEPKPANENVTRVQVSPNGPYLVKGRFLFTGADGKEEVKEGNVALCRCGLSANKPFCDGNHKTTDILAR